MRLDPRYLHGALLALVLSAGLLRAEPPAVSLESVIARALEIRPGKFLEAEIEKTRSGPVYEIEILGKDHVIYKLKFDAQGRFLSEEED